MNRKSPDEINAMLAALAAGTARNTDYDIAPVERTGPIPASFAQERFWFLHQLAPLAPTYNMGYALRVRGPLDVAALGRAIDALVERQESLRTTFEAIDGKPMQRIHPPRAGIMRVEDAPASEDAALGARAIAQHDQPFDLVTGPLLRATLLRHSAAESTLLVTIHHAVGDAASWDIFIAELAALYAAFARGLPSPLPPLRVHYADYAAWQRAFITGPRRDEQVRYWKEQLAGAPQALDLPTDRARAGHSAGHHGSGADVPITVPKALTAALAALARKQRATLNMALLAAFNLFLARHAGQDDVVVGLPSGVRTPDSDAIIGLFVNSLALRVSVAGDPTFVDLLERTKGALLGAVAHEALPFQMVVEALDVARDPTRNPVYQVMFAYSGAHSETASHDVTFIRKDYSTRRTVGLDLTFFLREEEGQLRGLLEYNADLFDAATVERMRDRFLVLLEDIVAHPTQRASALALLPERERAAILAEVAPRSFPVTACVHTLFEDQVERTPDAIAVVAEGGTLTYRQLNERANRLAHRLRDAGVGPEVLVAFCLERTADPIVAILAILKAGGGYLPIDPSYPPERRAWILEDSKARVALRSRAAETELAAETVIVIEDALSADPQEAPERARNPSVATSIDHVAYVIYTSGSTGKPKGSVIPHRNLVRLMRSTEAWFQFGPDDCWTVFHSFAFDFSVWEMWGALLYGGRALVVPYAISRSPKEMLAWIIEHRVTVLNQTPSAFRQLMQATLAGDTSSLPLRWIIFGGEALDIPMLAPWFDRFGDTEPRLVNMYGITETTVHVTYRPLRGEDARSPRSVIGAPLPDLTLHVLDRNLEVTPIGITGELYVGGAGASRCYLGRPALTAERFLPDPFASQPGARLYRSGDLGRRLPSGEVEYLGRADFQVKIRGFRIELGEIEQVLAQHPSLRDVIVLAREDAPGDKRLVAYLTAKDPSAPPPIDGVREHLRARLPEYMVPAALVFLDALPLTSNGKLDRAALPVPGAQTAAAAATDGEAPRSAMEETIAKMWSALLRVESVGVNDDFFDLGGHSLLLTQLAVRITKEFGVELSLGSLFDAPTVKEIAALVAARQAGMATDDAAMAAMLAEVEGLSAEEAEALSASEDDDARGT